MNTDLIQVGQIWDDVFGHWTYKVVAKTDYNVVLRRLEYGDESSMETLKPYHTFRDGAGWRLISSPDLTFKFDPAIVKELAQTAFITVDGRKVSDE